MQAFSDVRAIPRKQGKCIACEFIPSGLVDNLIRIKCSIIDISLQNCNFLSDIYIVELTIPYEYEDTIFHKYSTYNFGQAQQFHFLQDRY